MSQTVHFQGNPVTVANVIPQAGSKAQAFLLLLSQKICLTFPSANMQANAKC